jgi:cytoskeletal protein CcmA (bactofilin family)
MSFFGGRKSQSSKPTSSFPPPPAAVLPRQPVGFETVLGVGTVLKGDLKCQGNIRMDGTFEGTLHIEGNVLVGETAKITADISAKNVSIAGAVRGNVSGKKVQLLRTARVWGDISSSAISTEEGAFIDGKISMVVHDADAQPDPEPEPPGDDSAPAADVSEEKPPAE